MADCYGYTGKNATDNVIVELLSKLEEEDNPALYVFVSCDSDYRVEIDRLLSTNQHVAVIHRRGRELQKGDQVFFLANGKLETEYADVLAQLMRLFVGEPVWTPYNRPQEEHPVRKQYIKGLTHKFGEAIKAH